MSKNNIKIGLFGFGVVGEGLYHVLQQSGNEDIKIKSVCVKNKNKKRAQIDASITTDQDELLLDKEINLIVELIDDADEAYKIVKKALLKGKSVVSGNKKMLAYHLPELIEIQKKTGTALLYDASACGSIPVIRNLEEYYDNDLLQSVTGILNGSSNYILSKLFNEGSEYDKALREAQDAGFAESNPFFDVEGFDSLYKLVILTIHSFGVIVNPDEILNLGISKISNAEIQYAKEKNFKIKLVAKVRRVGAREVALYILPEFVKPDNYIFNVENEYNGVVIEGKFYEKQFMFGKGAGGFPTGSSVLSDITARSHEYGYEYKKLNRNGTLKHTNNLKLKIYLRYADIVDLSLFEFEEIIEKYSGRALNYVIGYIQLEQLIRIKSLFPKLNVCVIKLPEEGNE